MQSDALDSIFYDILLTLCRTSYRVAQVVVENLLLTLIWDALPSYLGSGAATIAAHQLPEVPDLSQQEVFHDHLGHPVDTG